MDYLALDYGIWQERCDLESICAQEDWESANQPEPEAAGSFDPEF